MTQDDNQKRCTSIAVRAMMDELQSIMDKEGYFESKIKKALSDVADYANKNPDLNRSNLDRRLKIDLLSQALTPVFGPFAEVIARKIVDRKDDRGMGGDVAWIPTRPDTGTGGAVLAPRDSAEYKDSASRGGLLDRFRSRSDTKGAWRD